MEPIDIYKSKVHDIISQLYNLYGQDISKIEVSETKHDEKIEIKELTYYNINNNRKILELTSFWFEHTPVKLIQTTGFYGEDKEVFIIDEIRNNQMIKYLELNSKTTLNKFGKVNRC